MTFFYPNKYILLNCDLCIFLDLTELLIIYSIQYKIDFNLKWLWIWDSKCRFLICEIQLPLMYCCASVDLNEFSGQLCSASVSIQTYKIVMEEKKSNLQCHGVWCVLGGGVVDRDFGRGNGHQGWGWVGWGYLST